MSHMKNQTGPTLPSGVALEGRRARRSRVWLSDDTMPATPTMAEKMKKKKARKSAAKARKGKRR